MMNINILKHGEAYQVVAPKEKDSQLVALMASLKTLGHSSALIGGADRGAHCVAIELPCGLPLYINFQYRTYAEREKGFLHFFTFTSIRTGSDKIEKAKKALGLEEPKRFTLKTINAKKLQAVIDYWDDVASAALTLENSASQLLDQWRKKLEAMPYDWRKYSHKENGDAAINGAAYSDKFEYTLSLSASYPHPSQSIKYRGGNTINDFLIISDDTSNDKQWFSVHMNGLGYALCYGTEFAVNLWCDKERKTYGAKTCNIAPINAPLPNGWQIVVVRLGDLL